MRTTPDFEALFRASPYPYLLMDKALTIIGANDAYLKATGRTEEELLGRWVFDAFPENPADPSSTNVQQVRSSLERAIASGKPDTTPLLRYAVPIPGSDGLAFDARYWNAVHTPVFGPDGEVAFVVQNAIDVTDLYRLDIDSQLLTVDASVRDRTGAGKFNRAQLHEAMMRVLRDERSHLRNLFNQSPGFIAVLMGPQHVFEMVNEAYLRLVGHRDLLGKPMFEALPELKTQGFEPQVDQVYRMGEPWVGHGIKLRVQGQDRGAMLERYVDLVYQPFHGTTGEVAGIFVQGHDTTEAHQARAAEREIEARWKLALEASGSGAWDWDCQSDRMVLSPTWKAMLGYSASDVEDGHAAWERLVHPDDLPQTRAAIAEHLAGQVDKFSSEYRMRHRNGTWRWILGRGAVVQHDAAGRPSRMIGTHTDVSHIKRIEEDLRIERDRSQSIFDSMAEGFAAIDRHWTVRYVNAEGLRLGGRTAQQVIGRDHWQVWPELIGGDVERLYRRVMETRSPDTLEFQHAYADGSTAWIEARVYPARDGELSIFFRDVTSRKDAEDKLREADRRKDEFLAMLAHELRNPLAPIGAAAELLQRVGPDESRVRQTSKVISRQVNHMTGLIDDLLDVSRVTRGLIALDKVALDIQSVIDDAVEQVSPLMRAREHELTVRLAPQTATVMADKKRVVQVLSNVLNNAAKYTAERGHLVLTTAVRDSDVLIEVTDDGIGMSPDTAEHAFDLFAQAERTSDRSSGGLGLGLALVKSLVELHGGRVSCRSGGLGQGSTFSIVLPRLLEQSHPGPGLSPSTGLDAAPEAPLRVLVVDDNVDLAEMLKALLESVGHQVLVEHAPSRALERARLHKPQVCLLDIGLPEFDGNELARRLRAQPETRAAMLVAVTGYGQQSDRAKALSAGFDHHLVKPVDLSVLASILSTVEGPR